MNKAFNLKYAAISSAIALMLVTAPVAFADSDHGKDGKDGKSDRGHRGFLGLHLGELKDLGFRSDFKDHKVNQDNKDTNTNDNKTAIAGKVTATSGTTLTVAGNNGTTYTVDAANATVKGQTFADIAINDTVIVYGTLNGTAITAKSIFDTTALRAKFTETMSHLTGGIVTAVNGSVFTLDSVKNPTTTVVTDSNTTFKAKGNNATTSAALQVGQRVIVVGTTTATSTTGDTFTASIVKIVGNGLKHLRFWLWF